MKKILFLLALICCYGCSESTTEMNENTAQQMYNSIKGTYTGNIMVDNVPQKVSLTVGNDLTVKYLPVRPILERIFTDGAALDEAEKTAGAVVFTATIDQMMVSEGNVYLTLEPTDLVFNVKVGDKTYPVAALLEGGLYANRATDELSMIVDVTQLNCDGISYDMTQNGVTYIVDNAKKDQ